MIRRIDVQIVLALVLLVGGFLLGTRLHGGKEEQNHRQAENVQAGDNNAPGSSASASTKGTGHGSHDASTLWTCSMHPQIKLPNPGKCPICSMDLIPLETQDSGSDSDEAPTLTMSKSAFALAEIETTPVRRGKVSYEVRMVGRIDFDETRVKTITAWVPGRLDRLYVDFTGVRIKRGDPLVSIYSPELVSTQEELLQALRTQKELSESKVSLLKDTADQTVSSAREKLRLLGLTDKQIAAVEKNGKAEDHVIIYAPIDGVVIKKRAVEGDYVKTGQVVYEVADLTRLWVKMDAYESDLPWLHLRQEVTFTAAAYPGKSFSGRISFIDPVLNARTRTAAVRVEMDNPKESLKPGVFVHGLAYSAIDTQPGHEKMKMKSNLLPLLIPSSAPLITGKRAVVYVRIPDEGQPRFEGREVVLGPRAGNQYIVDSGLEEGELVVTHGAFKIDSAMQIQAKPSMMSPEGGAPAPNPHAGMDMSGDDSSMDGKDDR